MYLRSRSCGFHLARVFPRRYQYVGISWEMARVKEYEEELSNNPSYAQYIVNPRELYKVSSNLVLSPLD